MAFVFLTVFALYDTLWVQLLLCQVGTGILTVRILQRFTGAWGLASETGGVTGQALCLGRIPHPMKVELASLVSFLSKGPMLTEVPKYI